MERVRYVRGDRRMSIGAQRNLACREARGDVIVHWDDDDWYGPERMRLQVEPIASGRADVTGLVTRYVWDLVEDTFWTMNADLHKRMFVGDVHGGTLSYRRSLLDSGMRYEDVSLAEDAGLLTRMLQAGARLERVPNEETFVYIRHGRNAWRFESGSFLSPAGWSRTPSPGAMGAATLRQYRDLASSFGPSARNRPQSVRSLQSSPLSDCLGNTRISRPARPLRFDRCIAFVASEWCADFLDGALASLAAFGGVGDVPRVVILDGAAPRSEASALRHGATVVRAASMRESGPWLKGALYSITDVVEAKQYLCLDADVLVLESVAPLFEMHAALAPGHVLIADEATRVPVPNLLGALQSIYATTLTEAERLVAPFPGAAGEPHVINDGVFVADFHALKRLDEVLRRALPLRHWISARRDVWWRAKAAMNIALAADRAIVPLDGTYNAQLHAEAAVLSPSDGRLGAMWRGRRVKVLHFNGRGKAAYPVWRAAVPSAR